MYREASTESRLSYRVEIPDADYYARIVRCRNGCPVHTFSGRYAACIADGLDEEAFRHARRPNPLASICARICAAPCEQACRRGMLDAPVALRALKRFVTERHGLEAQGAAGVRDLLGVEAKRLGSRSERVAIIGSGPAGLACAHDAALLGYHVTIFEAAEVPGGMLYLGIPEYRLVREVLLAEVRFIESLGVRILHQTRIGSDITLRQLREDFAAVFIAAGAQRSRELNIPGTDLDGVLRAVDFLLNANLGYEIDVGGRVAVIGGGNVALDVARSALRVEEESDVWAEDLHEAVDVARSAIRLGARQVGVFCLESPEEIPADQIEIEEAQHEGIRIHYSRGPKAIIGEEGSVRGLETIRCTSVFDEQGRFAPTFEEDSQEIFAADTVILAIGQAPDLSFLGEDSGIAVTPRGTIQVDEETLATTAPGVFVGGDVAFGPRIAIQAIADGRRAALGIHAHLTGGTVAEKVNLRLGGQSELRFRSNYDALPRQPIPTLPVARRIGLQEVEQGYSTEAARIEGSRCLRCNVNTIFDSARCILCGGCVDVCPNRCLRLVSFSDLSGDENLASLAEGLLGPEPVDAATAIIKDEDLCIRCGLCSERCPTGAITMEIVETTQTTEVVWV